MKNRLKIVLFLLMAVAYWFAWELFPPENDQVEKRPVQKVKIESDGIQIEKIKPDGADSTPDLQPFYVDNYKTKYLRVARPTEKYQAMLTACKKFSAPGKPDVWLSGVCHVGDKSYYSQLQKHLATVDLVLFEGVGATKKSLASRADVSKGLQDALAKSLGLVFQLSGMDYQQENFRNSDISREKLQARLDQSENGIGDVLKVMSGESFASQLGMGLIELLGSSNKGRAMIKLAILSALEETGGDPASLATNTPALKELFQVLLNERNVVVFKDLKNVINDEPEVKSISIFYGAAHMAELEKMLAEKLGYRQTTHKWFRAFGINLQAAGISRSDELQIKQILSQLKNR